MKEIDLKIKGMVCTGCENRIKKSLMNIKGVKEVFANHETGDVKVVSNDELSLNMIKEVLTKIGFEVVEDK